MNIDQIAQEKIIFALDVPNFGEAKELVELLKDHIGLFKVGLELFVKEGPKILSAICESSKAKVFLDMKFHDIPATVKGAQEAAMSLGAEFITVHTSEGERLLKTVVKATDKNTRILGVTILTSVSLEELFEMGLDPARFKTMTQVVLQRAKMAKNAGCDGVVCSGLEAKAVKEEMGKDFIVVTPGIRLAKSNVKNDDQERICTPYDAIMNGADYIVVGRPIRDAVNKEDVTKQIRDEIVAALLDKEKEAASVKKTHFDFSTAHQSLL